MRSGRAASRGWIAGVLVGLIAGLALVGCGSRHEVAGDRVSGRVLTIYTGLPLQGPSAAGGRSVLEGERLALAEAGRRAGDYLIRLTPLDDATVARGGWDPGQVTLNAHRALADPSTIAYIGDFNSGATAVAIPPLNRTGILVVSPTNTAIGLNTASRAASPGEPDKYYPSNRRTFVRLPPSDYQQAVTQVHLQRRLGCRATYVLNDGEFDGHDAAAAFQIAARGAGLTLAGADEYDPKAQDYTSLALTIAQAKANCVLISALPENHAALLTRQLGAAMPWLKLFGISALAQPSFTDPGRGGIPADLDPRVFITAPAVRPALSAAFDARFTARFGAPGPYAAYGYEAMRLVLDAIEKATDGGHDPVRRSTVLRRAMGTTLPTGPLGSLTVHADGTTTLRSYGVFALQGGSLVLWYVSP